MSQSQRRLSSQTCARRLVAAALFCAAALVAVGCASSSNASNSSGAHSSERVQGTAPTDADQVRVEDLPRGPAVLGDNSQASQKNAAQPDEAQPHGARPHEAQKNAAEGAEASNKISRAELNAFIQKGPSFGLAMVQVEPARDGQKFLGFQVAEIHPAAADTLADKVEVGDIITHLNGVKIKTPDDYMSAWRTLSASNEVTIDLIRNGAPTRALWVVDDQ